MSTKPSDFYLKIDMILTIAVHIQKMTFKIVSNICASKHLIYEPLIELINIIGISAPRTKNAVRKLSRLR